MPTAIRRRGTRAAMGCGHSDRSRSSDSQSAGSSATLSPRDRLRRRHRHRRRRRDDRHGDHHHHHHHHYDDDDDDDDEDNDNDDYDYDAHDDDRDDGRRLRNGRGRKDATRRDGDRVSGLRTWSTSGFPAHRITKVTQVEQVDVCEEQNNKIFTKVLNDDYNNSKGFPEVLSIHGSWVYGINAGGSRNNLDMFETNPQYLLKFPTGLVDENLFITIKIVLKVKRLNKKNPLYVAFFLYKNDFQQKEKLGAEYFLCTEPEGSSGTFKAKQVIFETFVVSTLASYVIVPATFRPFQQGEFMIKVMVDRKLGTELKKLIPPTRPSVGSINIQ